MISLRWQGIKPWVNFFNIFTNASIANWNNYAQFNHKKKEQQFDNFCSLSWAQYTDGYKSKIVGCSQRTAALAVAAQRDVAGMRTRHFYVRLRRADPNYRRSQCVCEGERERKPCVYKTAHMGIALSSFLEPTTNWQALLNESVLYSIYFVFFCT